MLSRILVIRAATCLAPSRTIAQRCFTQNNVAFRRFFSEENQVKIPSEGAPAESVVESVTPVASEKKEENSAIPEQAVENANPVESKPADSTMEAAAGNNDVDKQFLQDLLTKISVETHTEKEKEALIYDLNTILKDKDFAKLFGSLAKTLSPHYFTEETLLKPSLEHDFVARIQNELKKGSFVRSKPSTEFAGLEEKKRLMTEGNEIIRPTDSEDQKISYPLPNWLLNDLDAKKKESAKKSQKTAESSKSHLPYSPHYNNEIEREIDGFGPFPLRNVDKELQLRRFKTVTVDSENGPIQRLQRLGVKKNVFFTESGRIAVGMGKRKDSTARVFVREGTGRIEVNGKLLHEIFPMGNNRDQVLAPLAVIGSFQKFDVHALVRGGGTTGQSEAVRLALAKAITNFDSSYGKILSAAGLLTADPRRVERKKPGFTKARRPQQWVKR